MMVMSQCTTVCWIRLFFQSCIMFSALCSVFRSGVWVQYNQSLFQGELLSPQLCPNVYWACGEHRYTGAYYCDCLPYLFLLFGINVYLQDTLSHLLMNHVLLIHEVKNRICYACSLSFSLSFFVIIFRLECWWIVQSQWKSGCHSETALCCQSWYGLCVLQFIVQMYCRSIYAFTVSLMCLHQKHCLYTVMWCDVFLRCNYYLYILYGHKYIM